MSRRENRFLLRVFYNVFICCDFQFSSFREWELSAIGMCVLLYACVDYAVDRLQTISFICFLFLSSISSFAMYFWLFLLPRKKKDNERLHLLYVWRTELVIHYIFVTLQLYAPNVRTIQQRNSRKKNISREETTSFPSSFICWAKFTFIVIALMRFSSVLSI